MRLSPTCLIPFLVVACHGTTSSSRTHAAPGETRAPAAAHEFAKRQPKQPGDFLILRREAGAAMEARDWTTARERLLLLIERFGTHPGALWALGLAETHLGHFDAALQHLQDYAATGLARAGATNDPELTPLHALSGWQPLLAQLAENDRPVSRATLGLRLPDEELLTEDVAWNPGTHTFYVSSVRAREILAVQLDGTTTRFKRPGEDGLFSVLGLALDANRGRLWATSAALPQAVGLRAEDTDRTAIHLYDLASGRLLEKLELPVRPQEKHAFSDVSLAANGDAYVADDGSARVYVAHAADSTLEPLDDGQTFGSPQTPALSPDGKEVLVPDYGAGIAALDLATRTVRWISHAPRIAVTGIDGLYFLDDRTLLAIQNGTTPRRVVRLDLDEGRRSITALTVLEQNSALLGDPTHGVIVGDDLWLLGHSGWDHMNDDGTIKKGESLRGSVLLRLHVR